MLVEIFKHVVKNKLFCGILFVCKTRDAVIFT